MNNLRRTFAARRRLLSALVCAPLIFNFVHAAALGVPIAIPTTTLLDGSVLAPDHWRGKLLIVERFATWCPFCKVQNPLLEKLYRSHKAKGLDVLLLSVDKNPTEVPKYIQQFGYTVKVAMMTPAWQAALGNAKGLPVIWVIGRDGTLKQLENGELHEADIAELARWL
jgi:thiol-disulfide isomerase/thioredoxin